MDPFRVGMNMVKGTLAGYPFFYHLLKNALRSRSGHPPDPEALEKEAAYALQVAGNYLDRLSAFQTSLQGKRVVELGPGRNLGTSLILACQGAEVIAVEPRSALWDPEYHPRFYAALRDLSDLSRTSLSPALLDRVVAEGRIPEEAIDFRRGFLEDPPVLEAGSVEVIFSNAVLEHVFDLRATLAEMGRITRPGGLGFHQVDFRFHSNQADPLKFLLYGPGKYKRLRGFTSGECGSTLRCSEYREHFEKAGFKVVGEEINLVAEPRYLAGIVRKLRKRKSNPYRDWPVEDLGILSARFEVVKKG